MIRKGFNVFRAIVLTAFRWITGLFFGCVLLAPGTAFAGGVVNADGYVEQDGMYFKGNIAYTRSTNWEKDWYKDYYTAYSYTNCCYVPYQTYRWLYNWKSSYSYAPVKIDLAAPDVKARIIALAESRQRAVLKIAEASRSHQENLELIDKLGLTGNFNVPAFGYGIFPVANYGYNNTQYSSLGQQGNSLYAYRQSVDAFGVKLLDLDAAALTSARLVQGGLDYANTANSGYQSIVREGSLGAARIAEIRERGRVAVEVLRSTEPQPVTRTQTNGTLVVPNPVAPPTYQPGQLVPRLDAPMPPADQPNGAAEFYQRFILLAGPANCVSCHGEGGKDQKRFNLVAWNPRQATKEARARVIAYMNDPNGCPKDASGKKFDLPAHQQLQILTGE